MKLSDESNSKGKHFNFKDITGKKFGKWRVVKLAGRSAKQGRFYWNCRCDCGVDRCVAGSALICGASKSCGCINYARLTRHGMSRVPEYSVWSEMRKRCNCKSSHAYSDYGGRGISICRRWGDFALFYKDMGKRPSPKHTIERINNNSGYEPSNCKWALRIEQMNNTRFNIFLEFGGKRQTIAQWTRELGFKPGIIACRYHLGWSAERALTAPVRQFK